MNDTAVAPSDTTPTWIRLGLVALAVPQLVTGLWATLDPAGWYAGFPGFGADLVAAEPPYNHHLTTDAGAGFLATAVILLLGALWGRRREVVLALVGYTVLAVPHFLYHAMHEAPGLTSSENAGSVASVAIGAGLPVLLLAALWRTSDRPSSVAVS